MLAGENSPNNLLTKVIIDGAIWRIRMSNWVNGYMEVGHETK